MEIPEHILEKFQPLDHASFEEIRDDEFRPSFDVIGLKYLREKARNERDMRELYRGRAPYELLQNADDAEATKVAFVLSPDGLAFVHDGRWFTVDNFRSLADGWSDKDPGQCIGHKGLGFRSVLDITPAPYLLKIGDDGFFGVKFTWALNNGHIHEAFQRDPSLRKRYEDWTKHGQQACPIMAIPGLAKKHNLDDGAAVFDRVCRGELGGDFTTMFWFPARDPDIDATVLDELSPMPIRADERGERILLDFLRDEVNVLLPFLASVSQVVVYLGQRRIGIVELERTGREKESEVTITSQIGGQIRHESFFQMHFAFRIPPNISNQPDTPKAVKAMDEAQVVLSAKLEEGQPIHDRESRFHVYFPTEEPTGLGFVVHGDFYVKPDRTRLMSGGYNEWLLARVAEAAADRFLTRLLKRYQPRPVFEVLSPVATQSTAAASTLVTQFSNELSKRKTPFIPTSLGLLRRSDVVLPPKVDPHGFWESHFSDAVSDVRGDKQALLSHEVDSDKTRAFLDLAGMEKLDHEAILEFIETAALKTRPAAWWYECYSYLANDSKVALQAQTFFAGRELIPTEDSRVSPVPEEGSLIVCLPPASDLSNLRVPGIFSSVFTFLDPGVAEHLNSGADSVRSWVLDRLRISRFEATDLLPRAVRSVGPDLFSGELGVTASELRQAWLFIKSITDSSRTQILSPSFWNDLGRLPLPLDTPLSKDEALDPKALVPAFLLYWPDSFTNDPAIAGIKGSRRIDEIFLSGLIEESNWSRYNWKSFFNRVGVSETPKILNYGRIVAKGEDLPFVSEAPDRFRVGTYTGERQADENLAVVETLRVEDIWRTYVASSALCNHSAPKIVQSLTVLEGMHLCSQAAQQEYDRNDDNWSNRLWALVKGLSRELEEWEEDTVFCARGGRGGHSIQTGSYLRNQLGHYRWLPSTQGPASSSECFVRLASRRLISTGRSDEELGDLLFPYVVVNNVDDLAQFVRLGVEELDDPGSASSDALIRALMLLGERLSTEWGQREIMDVRSRWRLVRGAIQEIYRALNQHTQHLEYPPDIRFATRSGSAVEFRTVPLYYAEPGSMIEQAFLGALPLLDADRPYPRFFEHVGITRLVPGDTVEESFLAEDRSVLASVLKDEIVEKLSPFLLAPIIAKSDAPNQRDVILRRLRERFEVKAVDRLTVSYSLIGDSKVAQTIEFPKFYLQRRVVPGPGAVQEAYYILYVAGRASISLTSPDLDADALGASLAPLFLDGMSEELAGLFPRIVSRYYHRRGEAEEMREFLHRQLGISEEAQELAGAVISGETVSVPAPPPPVKVVRPIGTVGSSDTDKQDLRKKIQAHREEITQKTHTLVPELVDDPREKPSEPGDATHDSTPVKRARITPDQELRGKRGEEEIKRRLEQSGGWEGFKLISDVRNEGCGYDFLCKQNGQRVMVEVKTFSFDGQIFMTNTELQVAASNRGDYYLIGVLDDGGSAREWRTFYIQDPITTMLVEGSFDIQATLKAPAAKVFHLKEDSLQ